VCLSTSQNSIDEGKPPMSVNEGSPENPRASRQPVGSGSLGGAERYYEEISQRLGWHSGPAAQFEIICTALADMYRTSCNLPWRAPVRRPVRDHLLTEPVRAGISKQILRLDQSLNTLKTGRQGAPVTDIDPVEKTMMDLGSRMYEYLLPLEVRKAVFEETEIFFEFGVDEKLDAFPIELIFDGTEYLCLKHMLGRYVVSPDLEIHKPPPSQLKKALLIAVPKIGGRNELDSVKTEAIEVKKLLVKLLGSGNVTCIGDCINKSPGNLATPFNLREHLNNEKYQIVHFCGHGQYNPKSPADSGLCLLQTEGSDECIFATQSIRERVGRAAPILCFINACDSARTPDCFGFGLQGIGKAFLETGSCLLGSRSRVHDEAAIAFAREFYMMLIEGKKSFGESIRSARKACKGACKNTPEAKFDWASYVFYGDPRAGFFSKEQASE
jgi:hypothetical protein